MAIPAGIIIGWITSASLPSGWSRVTTMDNRFGKGTTGSPAPNTETNTPTHVHGTSGHTHTINHNHTGTHPVSVTSPANEFGRGVCVGSYCSAYALALHTHTFTIGTATGNSDSQGTADWSAGSSDPAYYTVRWIQSDGNPSGFPDDSVVFFNDSSPPSGWIQHVASKEKFIIGADTGANGNGTGGGGSHTHTPGAHTHTAGNHTHGTAGTSNYSTGSGVALSDEIWGGVTSRATYPGHSHTSNAFSSSGSVTTGALSGGTSGATTYTPTFFTLLGIENTSGSDNVFEGMIVGWLGTIGNIPDEWILCDGNNDTPNLNGKFIKMANAASQAANGSEVTGGTAGHQNSAGAHTHTQAHTHTNGGTNAGYNGQHIFGAYFTSSPPLTAHKQNTNNALYHTHPASGTSSAASAGVSSTSSTLDSTANTEPANRTMAWLQYQPEAIPNVPYFGVNF